MLDASATPYLGGNNGYQIPQARGNSRETAGYYNIALQDSTRTQPTVIATQVLTGDRVLSDMHMRQQPSPVLELCSPELTNACIHMQGADPNPVSQRLTRFPHVPASFPCSQLHRSPQRLLLPQQVYSQHLVPAALMSTANLYHAGCTIAILVERGQVYFAHIRPRGTAPSDPRLAGQVNRVDLAYNMGQVGGFDGIPVTDPRHYIVYGGNAASEVGACKFLCHRCCCLAPCAAKLACQAR